MKIYDYSKISKIYFVVVSIFVLAGIGVMTFAGGFQFGIEFNPGANLTVRIGGSSSLEEVESILREPYPLARVQILDNQIGDYLLRVPVSRERAFQSEIETDVTDLLAEQFASVRVLEFGYVGEAFSRTFQLQTGILTSIALLLILVYLWFRFRFNFAISSIITLVFHDALVVLVFLGVTRIEVTSATIAAILTVLGYSLNDTIVVFDRIRENLVLMKNTSMSAIVNTSVTQSLRRTIITSLTTLLASIALIVFAEGSVRNFAIVLSFGVLSGTFSSIFIASPLFLFFERRNNSAKNASQSSKEPSLEGAAPQQGMVMGSNDDINLAKLREELGGTKRKQKKKKRS